MKKLIFPFIVISFLFSGKIFSQGMVPPPPLKSEFIDASLGTWVSDPYEIMGMKMSDEVTHKMILNGQFMEVDIKGKSDNGFVYEAKGIIAPSEDGTLQGWFFDVFGKNSITNYTGTTKGTNVSLSGTSNWGTEKRDISINGDILTHNVSYMMKDASGKEVQQNVAITYKKKN